MSPRESGVRRFATPGSLGVARKLVGLGVCLGIVMLLGGGSGP